MKKTDQKDYLKDCMCSSLTDTELLILLGCRVMENVGALNNGTISLRALLLALDVTTTADTLDGMFDLIISGDVPDYAYEIASSERSLREICGCEIKTKIIRIK